MEEVTRIVHQYDRGVITHMELIARLLHLATTYTAVEIAAALPPYRLAELRAKAAHPPAGLEECPSNTRFLDASTNEDRRLWFSGIWRWHHDFVDT